VSERSRELGEGPAPFRHENHRRPRTRREFLAQGLIGGLGFVVGPSLFGLLAAPRRARAQALNCNLSAGAGRIPFLCFDLAGGANVAGSNVVVGGPGGALDPLSAEGYRQLGLPDTMLPQLPGQTNLELGLPFHADSAFLRGILSKTSPTTRANVNGTVICARSENDTGNNPHNPTYGIARAGAAGELAVLIGTQSSVSGGNSQAPMSMIDAALRPTKVDRPTDATGLVDTGKLVSLLNQADAAAVMRAVEELAEPKLARMSESQGVLDLMRCGYVETTYLVSTFGDPTILDPRLDPDIVGAANSIFTAAEFGNSTFVKTGSVMKLVVNGFAGAGTLEFGGYDYHDSTRATGERRDFAAGQAMGAALEYAARRGRQLMLYVFSDGSVNSTGELDNSVDGRGKGIWKADDSQTAAAFILVHDPAGRPQLSRPNAGQIGHFRANGDLETAATRVSNNVDRLAEAIVLNYLALHDEVGRLAQVLPGHGLGSTAEIDSLVAFAPIRAAGT
jgi:hypothetical protein